MNTGDTGGVNGAHLAVAPGGKFLLVANYGSGTVAVLPVSGAGELSDQVQLVRLEGEAGPHRVEQTGFHPHQIVFDPSGRFVLVPDKGLDRIFAFRFDGETGSLAPTAQGSAVARAGSGPRRLAFHPTLPVAWVLNELNSSITMYSWDFRVGGLKPLQILPTLPSDFIGESTAAEIATGANGRMVYCSNRGHDSIASFAAEPRTGLLRPAGWTQTQGKTPRFIGFEPSQRFLYSANQDSDTISVLQVKNGSLSPAGRPIPNRSAVTIAFARYTY